MCVACDHVTFAELGKVEDEIFKSRRQKDLDFRRRNREKRRRTNVSRGCGYHKGVGLRPM